MNDWLKKTIKEVSINIIDGDRGVNYPKKNEFNNDGFCLFLNTGNVTKNGFSFSNKYFISKDKDDILRKGKLERNDIVLTTRGTVGNVGYYNIDIPYDNIRINSGMVILRVNEKEIYPYYFYLFLRSKLFKKQVLKQGSGSAQPQLPIQSLNNIVFPWFDLQTQKQIAKVLSDLNAKIEINNKINQELEAMAKTLYDYWFVQFDFPNEQGKPYKSSGGEMVFNEELKREIPEGWEVKELREFCDRIGDGIHGTPKYVNKSNFYFINGNNLKNGFIQTNAETKTVTLEEYKKYFIELNNDSILLSINGTLGNLAVYTGEKVMLGKSSAYINCKKGYRVYCYQYLNQSYMQQIFWNIATGSTIKNLSLDSINKLKILYPNDNLIKQYTIIIKPSDNKRKQVFQENQQLTQLRDWLLPMLMNGQVTVAQAEEKLGMVAEERSVYKTTPVFEMATIRPIDTKAAIIGTHIVKELENSPGMGRTKFQKVLHIAAYSLEKELGGIYYKNTAGPHNNILINHIENKFKQYGHINKSQDIINGHKHIVYKTTSKTIESEIAYKNLPKPFRNKLDSLIAVFSTLNLKESEAISTLYAIWNNRIKENLEVNNNMLIKDFYKWSDRKKESFTDNDIVNALDVMKKHNIIPTGFGAYIDKQ